MELFKRDESIEKLLSELDIPQFVFPYEHVAGIGPYDSKLFAKHLDRRKDCEQKADSALHTMTDEDLWELCETPDRLRNFALEHSLFDPPRGTRLVSEFTCTSLTMNIGQRWIFGLWKMRPA